MTIMNDVMSKQNKENASFEILPEPPKIAPVKIWASVGGVIAIFYAYLMIAWVTGPYFKPVPPGPTPIPDWQLWIIRTIEPLGWVIFFIFLYYIVIRPYRREGRWTRDALLFIVFICSIPGDLFQNYMSPAVHYNTHFWNMGSWLPYIPGWQSISAGSPGRMAIEPMLFLIPAYAYGLFTIVLGCTSLMRRLKTRFPNIGNAQLIAVVMLFATIMNLMNEFLMCYSGIFAFGSTIPSLTFFNDEIYRFPLYESLLQSPLYAFCAWVRCFNNDKGESFVERGIEAMPGSQAKKTAVRFFAFLAAINVFALLYFIPFQFININGHAWPKVTQETSYFTSYVCGPETDQACPSENMPNPRWGKDKVHFDPQGKVVIPPGAPAPGSETAKEFRRAPWTEGQMQRN